jgi:hypothetical protein
MPAGAWSRVKTAGALENALQPEGDVSLELRREARTPLLRLIIQLDLPVAPGAEGHKGEG